MGDHLTFSTNLAVHLPGVVLRGVQCASGDQGHVGADLGSELRVGTAGSLGYILGADIVWATYHSHHCGDGGDQ